jgi:hypothetical protein
MTSLEDVQRYIQNSKDKGELVTIIELAERNIKRIETGKGIIRVVCIREQWYAKFPAGQPPMKLGKRLSTVEVLKRNRKKPPSPADYEISYEEAARRRLKNPSSVGWWEDDQRQTHYFDEPEYAKSKASFANWKRLAADPLAMTCRMFLESVHKLRVLEGQGYEIVVED